MSVSQLFSTIILVSFIVTLVLAVGSYLAYKLRERRKPRGVHADTGGPVFFERVYPAGRAATDDATEPSAGTAAGGR